MTAVRRRLCLDRAGGAPELDTALSRAVLQHADAGELPAIAIAAPPAHPAGPAR